MLQAVPSCTRTHSSHARLSSAGRALQRTVISTSSYSTAQQAQQKLSRAALILQMMLHQDSGQQHSATQEQDQQHQQLGRVMQALLARRLGGSSCSCMVTHFWKSLGKQSS
jgi:hypothetical protein